MKVKNESVTVKVGNKERVFTNLILNNYLDLYAESFVSFKQKWLPCCFIKFENTQYIDENSTTMDYDIILEAQFKDMQQIFTENNVTNKYMYYIEQATNQSISDFKGKSIAGIGFGNYSYDTQECIIYAFLDVSKYNIIIQESQSIVISRIDKIITDLKFYSPFPEVIFPTHLTMNGIMEMTGMDYDTIYSQLYSIGTGTLYNKMNNEVLVEDLDFKKIGTGLVGIEGAKDYATYPSFTLYPSPTLYPGRTTEGLAKLKIEDKGEGLYPSPSLYPGADTYPKVATDKWVIYKFKLYRQRWEGEQEIIEDTGLWYYQSQKTDLTGNLRLEIKYERS